MGCRILFFRGHPVTLICFSHGNTVAHLFIVDRAALPALKPQKPPLPSSQGDWTIATWADQHYACVVAVHDRPGSTALPAACLNQFDRSGAGALIPPWRKQSAQGR
jgi:hypothetical protein